MKMVSKGFFQLASVFIIAVARRNPIINLFSQKAAEKIKNLRRS
jgi:hypothetical protein